jgi:hypothetical protein
MNKYVWLLMLISPWLYAEATVEITPEQVLARMLNHANSTVAIDKWQQSPARVGVSHLSSGSDVSAGDETELNLTLSWNTSQNRQYLTSLETALNERQHLNFSYVKWQLTGELRRQWANLTRLSELLNIHKVQVQKLQSMYEITNAAFSSREITRIELLLVENALTDAEHQLSITQELLDTSKLAYQQFSGQMHWPMKWQETLKATDWQQHPFLLLQLHDVLLAENAFVRDSQGDNEPLQTGVTLRQTQGVGSMPDDTAIGLQFSMPFGGAAGKEQSVLAQQQMQQQQHVLAETIRQIRTGWFEAKALFKASEIALKSANQQWERGQEIQQAADAALKSGEISHSEWLRLFLRNYDLNKQAKLAAIDHAAAIAEFNQAGGLTW